MEYHTLTVTQLRQLRMDRLRALEADHARRMLELEEDPANAPVMEELAEIGRRIGLHVEVLSAESSQNVAEEVLPADG